MNQSKSLLARLLARENLTILVTNTETAKFDLRNRILYLPPWKDLSDDLYDLFCGHEVGHALHTPTKGWADAAKESRYYLDIVNVVEDIRIENKILEEFPGLMAPFIRGYSELLARNFFELDGKDLSMFNFVDKMNIHTKARGAIRPPFSVEEYKYLNKAMSVKTWLDTVNVSKEIYDWLKRKNIPRKDIIQHSYKGKDIEDADADGEFKCTTQEKLKSNSSKFLIDDTARDTITVSGPTKAELDHYIIPVKSFLKSLKPIEFVGEGVKIEVIAGCAATNQQFEMRKAASRTTLGRITKNGSLNMGDLHKYKFEENIFRKSMIVHDAKSHGFVMLVDYSGSMRTIFRNVMAQLAVLTSFCKRQNVPFQIFGFTTNNYSADKCRGSAPTPRPMSISYDDVNIFEIMSSDLSESEYKKAYDHMLKRASGNNIDMLVELLAGTPLNSALVMMYSKVKEFMAKHSVQKYSFITLTDGASQHMSIHDDTQGFITSGKISITLDNRNMITVECNKAHETTHIILDAIKKLGVVAINYFYITDARLIQSKDKIINAPKLLQELMNTGVRIEHNSHGYDIRFFILPRPKHKKKIIKLISCELAKTIG